MTIKGNEWPFDPECYQLSRFSRVRNLRHLVAERRIRSLLIGEYAKRDKTPHSRGAIYRESISRNLKKCESS